MLKHLLCVLAVLSLSACNYDPPVAEPTGPATVIPLDERFIGTWTGLLQGLTKTGHVLNMSAAIPMAIKADEYVATNLCAGRSEEMTSYFHREDYASMRGGPTDCVLMSECGSSRYSVVSGSIQLFSDGTAHAFVLLRGTFCGEAAQSEVVVNGSLTKR